MAAAEAMIRSLTQASLLQRRAEYSDVTGRAEATLRRGCFFLLDLFAVAKCAADDHLSMRFALSSSMYSEGVALPRPCFESDY